MAGMLVFARLPDGTTVPCDVGPSSTVQDVTDMCGGSGLGRVAVLFGGKVVAGSDLLSDVGISSQSTLRITAAPELRFDRERCSEDLQIHGDDDRVVSGTTAARKELVFTTALPLPPSTGVYRWKVNVLEYVDGTYVVGIHRRAAALDSRDVVFYCALHSRHSFWYACALADSSWNRDQAARESLSCVHCEADTDSGVFRLTRQWEGGEEEKLWKDVQLDDFELVADFTMCDAVISIEAVSGCFRPRRMS
eukprot:TRINITY_DN1921_c0_g1_i15.p1 TRINITY_DN1921_c0_g1~~TRINITY_DN1921_c0_g1_i15.p1  ORF type:complete len:250 (+),score=53.96 TRINITY_DN1921_c0_g1_i15:76-825(+)